MRLLQVNLRSLLLCLLVLVTVSIPVSFFAIREILNEDIDENLALHSEQFVKHIKTFEYLDDLEMDLGIWDQLSYDITIGPASASDTEHRYQNVSMFDSVEHERRPFRILTTPVEIKNRHYLLTIRMSLVDNDRLVFALASVQGVIVVLLAIALLLLNRRLTERLWRPFYHTLNQLKAYELDKNESVEAAATKVVEFQDLNKAVSHLTERNRKTFLQQKEFLENASHELQTPLAVFQTKLDILMQNPSINEEAATTIAELEDAAQRMTRLNKSLLLLSKIDNDQFADSIDVDLSLVTQRIIDNLRTLAGPEIAINVDTQPVVVKANLSLMEVLFTNLFHNAIRYTTRHGMVNVLLADRTLVVSNVGQPLKMDSDRIFDRFTKEGGDANSTGLGLSIVKKICDYSGFTISYLYQGNNHIFTVVFPARDGS